MQKENDTNLRIFVTDASGSVPASTLGVPQLERMWDRARLSRQGRSSAIPALELMRDNVTLAGLGLAREETMEYLLQAAPGFSEFEQWVLDINGGFIAPEKIERINAAIRGDGPTPAQGKIIAAIENAPPVLSATDLAFWDEHGYVIVRGAISREASREAEQLLWAHLEMKSDDPETWYRPSRSKGIMVQLFHHPVLQRNRESPRIHKAFAQLWGTADLWVTTDRMSFNPPERPDRPFQGPRLHWDTSVLPPVPLGLQGLLYLTDTRADQGAFTCVPGFHHRLEGWLKDLPPGANPREQNLESLGAKPIAAEAGDLIIWQQALPHGSSPNRATRPRMVHYLTMFPAIAEPDREWL